MKFLDENPAVADEIELKIREYYKENNDYDETANIGSDDDTDILDELGANINEEDLITPIPDDL